MNNKNFLISKKEISDLKEIWNYTVENWSQNQANRYYKLIFDEIIYLSENVEKGENENKIRNGYLSSRVKSHIIFYKKGENSKIIIVRILHINMDIQRHL